MRKAPVQSHVHGITIPEFLRYDRIYKSKLNGRQKAIARAFLIELYSESCAICGKPAGDEITLDVEHIDGNPKHHYWKNLQLACHKCNCQKDPKGKKKKTVCVSVCVSDSALPPAGHAETYLKAKYLTAFLTFLEDEFENVTKLNYKELILDGSVKCGMASEITIKRYLDQLCSKKFGLLEKYRDGRTSIDYVKLKKSHNSPSGKELINEFRKKYCW